MIRLYSELKANAVRRSNVDVCHTILHGYYVPKM